MRVLRILAVFLLSYGLLAALPLPRQQQVSAPAQPSPAKPAPAKATPAKPASATAAGPKSASVLVRDLEAQFQHGTLAADTIQAHVRGDAILLSGSVGRAEHKGVATRVARAVAHQDGWKNFHVYNNLTVHPHKEASTAGQTGSEPQP